MKRLILAALGYLAYRTWQRNKEPSAEARPVQPAGRKFAGTKKGERAI